jgi:hypothetical protein
VEDNGRHPPRSCLHASSHGTSIAEPSRTDSIRRRRLTAPAGRKHAEDRKSADCRAGRSSRSKSALIHGGTPHRVGP